MFPLKSAELFATLSIKPDFKPFSDASQELVLYMRMAQNQDY
jgi:hypothetical protein